MLLKHVELKNQGYANRAYEAEERTGLGKNKLALDEFHFHVQYLCLWEQNDFERGGGRLL